MQKRDLKLAKIIKRGFTQHSELNPKIFDENQDLRDDVRKKLQIIANDFIDSLGINHIDYEDVLLVGSIVNYNWNPYSDVDLHIVYDFNSIDGDLELVNEFFIAKKSLWNQEHDIKIYGYDVELYGQDINESNVSGGIYSILKNTWIQKPNRENYVVNENALIKKTKYFTQLIDDVLALDVSDLTKINKLKAVKEKIRKYRKSGLETGGEFSEENLVFKMLRRVGYMEKLSDSRHELEDKIMSLPEGLNLISKKKHQDKIVGNYPDGEGRLRQYWDNGKRKFVHQTFSDGSWWEETYNENGNLIYYKDSSGFWVKHKYDESENEIYQENINGYWSKREYDENGNLIYYENSNGDIDDNRPQNINEGLNLPKKKYREEIEGNYPNGEGSLIQYWDNGKIKFEHKTFDGGLWRKSTYDENENEIYYENSSGYWYKREYDENGNEIYFQDSDGYWVMWKYDENGNEIYFENSDGYVEDNRPQNINEGLNLISKKKYREEIQGNYPDGGGRLIQYWDNGNEKIIHRTFNNGSWFKKRYDENGNEIYFENSDGYWEKWEYDENGNQIYYEASDGYWEKWKYDENGYCIYFEQSNGYWNKHEYNENGNKIYYETSDGYWSKWEYNENGNRIYYEDSDGEIDDNRPQNVNEGLNLPKMTPQSWFKSILNKTTQHTSPKYPNSIFFKLYNDLIFEYDKKNQYFWIDYNEIWSVFETKFNLNYTQIKELTKGMVEEHYKLGPLTTGIVS